MLDPLQLTGRSRDHIVRLEAPTVELHREAAAAWQAMRAAAADDGIDLRVSSGFRDFASQASIWNRKWRGERPLLDANGAPVDRTALRDDAVIDHILRWSALPGASRHHWGTELDLYDAAAMPDGYRVQLVPAEFAADGVFGRAAAWLERHARRFGFYRPYAADLGGVCPEPWHWSYAPLSVPALATITPELIADAIIDADLDGKELVLARLPTLFTRYVLAVAKPAGGSATA
ncbi:MAG: M15 family metallopeptidase [Burkholderiales bacterium]|nr:M15 family metallopeptidase [Burkholderiales bacterium]